MGVYIPKMEMPRNCDVCPIGDCPYDAHFDSYRMIGGRPNDCPLVEVKTPHGRLIEAEMVKAKSFRYLVRNGLESARVVFWRNIDDAPTIIEAETCNNSDNTCNNAEDDAVNTSFPCDTCRFNPPSSRDGKPCTMCDTSNPLTNCYQKAEGEK